MYFKARPKLKLSPGHQPSTYPIPTICQPYEKMATQHLEIRPAAPLRLLTSPSQRIQEVEVSNLYGGGVRVRVIINKYKLIIISKCVWVVGVGRGTGTGTGEKMQNRKIEKCKIKNDGVQNGN